VPVSVATLSVCVVPESAGVTGASPPLELQARREPTKKKERIRDDMVPNPNMSESIGCPVPGRGSVRAPR
jgi:hypothetical protein